VPTIDELRTLILSFPETIEASHQGHPDFRVGGKIVVSLDEEARSFTVKLSLDDQQALMARGDDAFSLPGGWAKHGWTTIHLDHVSPAELEELVTDAWLAKAPEKLAAAWMAERDAGGY